MKARERAIISVLSFSVTVFATTAANAADEVSVILNWTTSGAHSPLFFAKKSGWFEEADLDVEIEQGKGSVLSSQKVGAGATDFGIADLGTAMVAKGSGANIVAVMNIFAKSPYQMYWLKSSGIKGIEDFPGRKFGNPPGDAARAMWPALANINDIDPGELTWVNIAPNAKVSALKSGAIEGTTFFSNYHYIMEAAFGDDLGWFAWSDKGLNPYGNSLVVNGDFLASNPDTVARFIKVAQRAYRYCVDNGDECVAVLPEYSSGLKPENEIQNWNEVVNLMTDEYSTTEGLGYFDSARIADDYELVTTYFKIKEPFDATKFYTNEFIDESVLMPE